MTWIFLAALLIWTNLSLSAEEIVEHQFRSENPNQQLEELLFLSAGAELIEAGISSSREGTDADYLLNTEYHPNGSTVQIHYILSRKGEPDHNLAEINFELRLSYDVYDKVAAVVRQLLREASLDAHPNADAEIKGLFPEHRRPNQATNQSPASADGKSISDIASPTKPPPGTEESGLPDLSVSLATGGILLLGKATEYFHYGAAGKASADFNWMGQHQSFSVGVDVSFIRIFNNQDVKGGPFYLPLTGVHLRYGSGNTLPYSLGVTLSGGAAVISVVDDSTILSKAVPQAELSVYAFLPVGKDYFIGSKTGLLAVFDKESLIMGITPAISVRKEW